MSNKVYSLQYKALDGLIYEKTVEAESYAKAFQKLPAFLWARPVPKVNIGKKVVKDFQSRIQR